MNNKKIYITSILAITAANSSFAQIRTVNSDAVGTATNSSAFIDASSNTSINGNPNLGKGLIFPRTDLSTFTTFGGTPFGLPNNYATYYDGMIVYNTKDGDKAGVGTTQGELKPGFWYYDNKSKSVNGGTWKQISSPTTNQLTLTGNSLISTVNGVASNSISLPVGNGVSASNGLSKTGDNIKLGGSLTEETTITTNGANRLFVKGSENNAINFDDNTFSVDAKNHRVGIGTNTPLQKLDVAGAAIISDKLSVGSTWQGAALAVDNKNASEPIVAFSGTGSQRRVTVLDDGNMGIGDIVPTQKLDVDGNVRLRGVTNTTTLLPTDKIIVLNANGEAKKIDAADFQQSVSKMYYKYYMIVKNNGDDWVSNFDTKIPHSKYTVVVTGFDTNLKAAGAGFNVSTGSSADFHIPNIIPFTEGTTWRLNIDVPNARPNSGTMAWGVKLLIISKDQITDLGSETFNLGSSTTGGDNASPVP